MRVFWLALIWGLVPIIGVLDYWCWKHHQTTLTRAFVQTVPAIAGVPLMLAGLLHMLGAYYRGIR